MTDPVPASLTNAYPDANEWQEAAPGKWRAQHRHIDAHLLALTDGTRFVATWVSDELQGHEPEIWAKLATELAAASPS